MTQPTPTATKCPPWRKPAVLRLLMVALFAEIGYAVLNISTMPVYLKYDRGFGEDIIGIVLTAFLLSEAVFKSYAGHLADRFSKRMFIVIGPCLSIFTAVLTLLVPYKFGYAESIIIIFLRILDGLGAAMLWPAAFALMSETVDDSSRQEAMSYLNTCYLVGIALALPLGGIVNDLFGIFLVHSTGMRSPGLYLAAILFGAVAFTAFFKLPKIAEHAYTPTTTESNEHNATNFFKTMRGIPQYIILGLLTFCGIGFPMTIVKIFAQDQFKLSESAFGALAMPGAIAMAVLSVPMAKWGEKFGRARSVHWGLFLCAVGVGVVALGGIAPIFRTPLMMALGGIPVGIGFLLAIPAWYASVSDINPTQRAVNIGAVMTAQGLGAIIGAPLGGAAYRYFQAVNRDFGHYSPFMGCALCLLLAWLVSVRILHDKVTPTSPVLADLVEPLTQTPPE